MSRRYLPRVKRKYGKVLLLLPLSLFFQELNAGEVFLLERI